MSETFKNVALIEKTLAILECMIDWPYGITLRELSGIVGINKSTVYRILTTLKDHGYVSQNPINSEYKLDYKFLNFNKVFDNVDIRRFALPHMQILADELSLSVNLNILDDCESLCIEKVTPKKPDSGISIQAGLGYRAPLHATANGKALLAGLVDEEVEKIIGITGLKAYTPNTITNPLKLSVELKKIREQGYSVEYAESEAFIVGIAAPIKNTRCIIYASICLSVLENNVTPENMPIFAERVKKCAEAISRDAGCPDYQAFEFREYND